MPRKKNEDLDDDDDNPFEMIDSICDSVEVITDDLGELRAVFYIAADKSAVPRRPFSVKELEKEKARLAEKGLTSPLNNQAIRLIREGMGLPTLQ